MRDPQDLDVLTETPPPDRFGGLRLAIPVALFVVLVDQVTKQWALSRLVSGTCSQPDACIDLIAGARFRLVFNTGVAFTTGSGLGPLWAVVALTMVVMLLSMARSRSDRWSLVLLGLVAGGAVGNLVDRVARADDGPLSGAVVDFIDLGWWPVFNVADAAIVGGVIVLIGRLLILGEE